MTGVIEIGPLQLALCLVFVLATGAASVMYQLGLGRDLVVGTVRCVGQLFLMGYVLKFVFALNMAAPVVGIFLLMTVAAVQVIHGRIKERSVPFVLPMFASMFLVYAVVSWVVVALVVGARPWWTPQYFIPLSGMIVGNSMTAIAIGLERLFSGLRSHRNEVEMRLCLGADAREAGADVVRDAVRAGIIPAVNSLMGVGLVFLPGMMTGQILAGADPLIAIRYQIVVMLMLAGSTALGTVMAVTLVRRRCFGPGGRLLLPRGRG